MPDKIRNYQFGTVILSLILVVIGMAAALLLIWLRPSTDPLVVMGAVFGLMPVVIGQFLTYAKTSETHALVNSQLDQFKTLLVEKAQASIDAARIKDAVAQALAANVVKDAAIAAAGRVKDRADAATSVIKEAAGAAAGVLSDAASVAAALPHPPLEVAIVAVPKPE